MQVLPIITASLGINRVNFKAISLEHLRYQEAVEALEKAKNSTSVHLIYGGGAECDRAYTKLVDKCNEARERFAEYLDCNGMSRELIDNEKKYRPQ